MLVLVLSACACACYSLRYLKQWLHQFSTNRTQSTMLEQRQYYIIYEYTSM